MKKINLLLVLSFCLFVAHYASAQKTVTSTILEVSDDAEEFVKVDAGDKRVGQVDIKSADLEFCLDQTSSKTLYQLVGMRFFIDIPKKAEITNAFIQFTCGKHYYKDVTITFHGEAADAGAKFEETDNNISSRSTTTASVAWQPGEWNKDEALDAEKTPDLSSIIQEVINRDGWQKGNSLVIIVSGDLEAEYKHTRNAYAYPEDENYLFPDKLPKLTIEYNDPATGIADVEVLSLVSNSPNPFTSSTDIVFNLAQAENVKIVIYDMSNKEVEVLADNLYYSGENIVTWNAGNVASGLYIAKIQTAGFTKTIKLLKK
jgi:hypothetical protein